MEKRKELKKQLQDYEILVFEDNLLFDTTDFYKLKRKLLKGKHLDLLKIFEILESRLRKGIMTL